MARRAYVNGVILDGTKDMAPREGAAILCDGERIEAVVEAVAG